MKTIRWFLSHFFLILLVVIVIYGYMFWGNLAGEKTPAGKALAYLSSEFVEVDEFIKAVKARQAQLSTEQAPAEAEAAVEAQSDKVQSDSEPANVVADSMPSDDMALDETPEPPPATVISVTEVEETVVVARNIEQQPVSISYSHNQMRVKQNSIGQIESQVETPAQEDQSSASTEPEIQAEADAVEPEPVAVRHEAVANVELSPETASQDETEATAATAADVAAPEIAAAETAAPETAVTEITDHFVSPKIEQQLNNVDKNGKVINPALKTYAIRDSWVIARKSFYQRKYELSEKSYRDVINNTTDNYDAYGELGNVYFNQGKNTEAAAAYFEAASILVRKGQLGRAKSLMGLLRHLDESKAVDLKKLIDSSAS